MSSRSLFSTGNPDAAHFTEGRRVLRTLLSSEQHEERKTYLVTSATQAEGKTTISALLGLVAAKWFDKRTLIIEGDTRRPTMHRLLDVESQVGLSDVLQGGCSWKDAVQPTRQSRLEAILSSRRARSPGDERLEQSFGRLMAEVREEFDLVIIDAPPLLPVVEPLLMAGHVESILLVLMAGRTRAQLARRAREILEPYSAKLVGCIVNNATGVLPSYYDYRAYNTRDPRGLKDLFRRRRR